MDRTAAVGPLAGVTVLDLGTVGPGARACRILADLGAAVTRLDPPPGIGIELPFHAYSAMRGVRRCRVDLRHDAGRAVALDLAAGSDVVVDGFRPGVADRLGVGYDAVADRNPGVVHCAASGYGATGPRSNWTGHDLNYLAVTGFLHMGERSGDRPALPGATVADAAGGGMHAALAVLAALLARATSGRGRRLDVAATDGVLGLMAMHVEEHLATDSDPAPGSGILTGRFACYGVYRCADGGWITVAAVEPKFFANLCRELGRPELIGWQYDEHRQDELRTALDTAFGARTRDEWVDLLSPRDTCVAPVLSVAEACVDVHHQARGLVVQARHPQRGDLAQLGPVWAGSVRPAEPVALAADGHTDTAAVLDECGYPADEVQRLLAAHVVA